MNRSVSVDRLVEGVWGEHPPESAPKMVQHYISQLRKLLAGDGAEIVTHGRGYELQLAADAVDTERFERLIAAAGHGAGNGAAREALALWRGDVLADVGRRAVRPRRDSPARGAAAGGGRARDRP